MVIRFWLTGLLFLVLSSSRSQELYDLDSVQQVRLDFFTEDWYKILDSYKNSGSDFRLPATLHVNGVRYDSVGVRFKGNSSYLNIRRLQLKKLPLNIKVNYVRKHQLLPGGYSTLKLSNGFRDPSQVREVLAYEIARNYLHAPLANFAWVTANGSALGLYTSSESVEDQFLVNHFGKQDGILVKCDPDYKKRPRKTCPQGDYATLCYQGPDSTCYFQNYEMKSKMGWKALVELTRIFSQEPQKLEQVLDVDQALWYLALNNVLANLDSYVGEFGHNFYIYQDSNRRFVPVIWDLNLAFGGFRFAADNLIMTDQQMQQMSVLFGADMPTRPLMSVLLKNATFRKMYLHHARVILEDHILNGKYLQRGQQIQNKIRPWVLRDEHKLYSQESFEQNLRDPSAIDKGFTPGIGGFMEKRSEFLSKELGSNSNVPLIDSVRTFGLADSFQVSIHARNVTQVSVMLQDNSGSFTRMFAFKKPAYDKKPVNPGQLELRIPRKGVRQFYIQVENADAMELHPRRARFELLPVPEEERQD